MESDGRRSDNWQGAHRGSGSADSHRHDGCIGAHIPKTRQEYWLPKFERNVENDKKHYHDLQEMGWRPIVIWECEVNKHFEETMERLVKEIQNAQD